MPADYNIRGGRKTPTPRRTVRRRKVTVRAQAGVPGARAKAKAKVRPTPPQPQPVFTGFKKGERRKIRRHKKSPQYRAAIKSAREAKKRTERREAAEKRELMRRLLRAHGRAKVDTDTKILGVPVEEAGEDIVRQARKELEGRGALTSAAKAVKKAFDKSSVVEASPTLPVGTATRKPASGTYGESSAKVFTNFIKDVIDLPAQVPASSYATGAAAFEAAKGDPSRAKALLNELKNKDAIALAAQGRWKEAAKSAEEHPGILALELWGGKGLAGRAATVGSRSPGKVRKLPDTRVEVRERREKDAIRGARRNAQEKRKRKQAGEKRERAREHEALGNPSRAKQLRDEARKGDPDLVKEPEIRRRVAERFQANEDIRRLHRTQITKRADETTERGAHGAGPLVAQAIVKPDRADLRAYVKELEAQFDDLTPAGKLANQDLRKQIQKALDNPKLDLAKVQAKAAKYRDLLAPLERKLDKQGILPKGQADRAKLIPYAVRNMGAKHDGDRLTLNGRKLTNREIAAHMKQNKVAAPAFVTQAPNMRGGKNFYQGSGERPKALTPQPRTGEATLKGTFDAHRDTLREGAARLQGLVDTNEGFRGFVREFGRREGKKVKTYKNRAIAQRKVNELEAGGGEIGWRAIRANPWAGRQGQLRSLLDEVDADAQIEARPVIEALTDAVEGKDGPGPWILVPEVSADEAAHFLRIGGSGGGGMAAQLINSAFRKTVLSTSTRWATGNVVEAGLRAAIMGAGPRSYKTGRRTLAKLKEIDPAGHEAASVRVVGGGHYSMVDRAHIRRSAEQFYDSRFEPTARVLGRVWRTAGPKQLARGFRVWTDFVFGSMRKLESQFQTAMFGKALREDLVRLGDKAIADAARGLKDTNAQVAYGRAVDHAYGRYSKWSPAERRTIALYTPFMAWTINAAYFITRTLPRDHPVLTGVLAAQHQMTEEWRKDNNLGKFLEAGVPNFLQGSIPTDDGGWLRVGRYTPFSIATSPLETAAGNVLPQYTGPLLAAKGLDWKGDKIYKDGREMNELEAAPYAAHEFLKATVPLLGQVERTAGREGSFLSKIRQELNPFEPTKSKPKERKKSSSSSSRSSSNPSSGNLFDSGGSSDGGGSSGGNLFD